MPKPYDTDLVMMVAQLPFETSEMDMFCNLIPIVYVDGVQPQPADFPNNGEIWWMLTAKSGPLAEPGRLVIGRVEDAYRFNAQDDSAARYQVRRDSIRDLELREGMQVLNVPADAIEDIQDLVSGGFALNWPVRPTPTILLRWRSNVYGPLRASQVASSGGSPDGRFVFSPADSERMTVYCVEESVFEDTAGKHSVSVDEDVSMTTDRREGNFPQARVTHAFVLAAGYEQMLATNPPKIVLEPLDRKLIRYAKRCLTRKSRQQLQSLLSELEVRSGEVDESQDLIDAIGRARQLTEKQDAALEAVTQAMLTTGILGEDRIQRAEQRCAQQYVEEKTAELQARVEQGVLAKRKEWQRVEASLKNVQEHLQEEENQRRTQFDRQLADERIQFEREMATKRKDFDQQKNELERLQGVLEGNLKQVTNELRNAGDSVVNRFLTLAPLLKTMGLGDGGMPVREASLHVRDEADPGSAAYELPALINRRTVSSDEPLTEDAFFARFQTVVEDSGFSYRLVDLQRFHLSVKCCEVTVLGGPSGTGKSSLPGLYAMAVLGGERKEHKRPGCLMVNVNPSWMDIRDLLGHLNTLEGRYYPAESGLFQRLIHAQHEYAVRGDRTGMHLVCLDEMNLSQVEHYFSDFMMVLERTGDDRVIQCFAPEVVSEQCPFRKWGRVRLSNALRFVGTVNIDETTRLLSDRFLDRVNFITLTPQALPDSTRTSSEFANAEGRIVTLSDFVGWTTDHALPSDLGLLLDQMRPLLTRMGCPISPRAYRGICRFVASAVPVMTPERAFDVQVAQRVIPKMRSLVTTRQIEAMDDFQRLVNSSNVCSFD